MGGLGGAYVPSEFGFEPRSPRYGSFLVLGLFDTNRAQSVHSPSGSFLGHIVELESKKGHIVTGQSRRMWSVATVSLPLAALTGLRGSFGPKKAVLGHRMRSFGRAPPHLAPPPRGATGDFLAENLDLARPPPRL